VKIEDSGLNVQGISTALCNRSKDL